MNRVPVFRKRAGPDVVFSKNLQACLLLIQLPETKDHLDLDFGQPGIICMDCLTSTSRMRPSTLSLKLTSHQLKQFSTYKTCVRLQVGLKRYDRLFECHSRSDACHQGMKLYPSADPCGRHAFEPLAILLNHSLPISSSSTMASSRPPPSSNAVLCSSKWEACFLVTWHHDKR